MQRCHINCGDRLSARGEWNEHTAGGTAKYTTFRNNPIFLVENKTTRAATVLSEIRHTTPLYVDESNCKHYPYTGLTLLQPLDTKLPPTPFITNGTHRCLQKGMMLDSREVSEEMTIPANTTCYLIPYTKDRGIHGTFDVSIYPDMAKLNFVPLRHAGLTLTPLSTVTLVKAHVEEGARLDFYVSSACNVHVIMHQLKVGETNKLKRGDLVSEDALTLSAFNEYGIRVGTTGEFNNAREQAMIFKAPLSGKYSLILECYNGYKSTSSKVGDAKEGIGR
uniref:Uncharacterized protein n=1 Tax=Lygus hesperus TaxID=30085 RepID=A0A146L2J4_LYGHE